MTELDITDFFYNACPRDYSASVAEIGQDAWRITWQAALDDSDGYQLLRSDDDREAFREFVRGLGAWSDDEVAAWSDQELNTLCIQFVSGDMREVPGMPADGWDWDKYEQMVDEGICSSRLFRASDGHVYFYIGE